MRTKMVKCKTCGEEIAKSAKICPKCGAKQKKHTVLGVVFLVFGILVIIAAIGGSGGDGKPQKISESNSPDQNVSQEPDDSAKPEDEIFTVGDSVSLDDIVVTLVDVSESDGGNYMTPEDGKVFILCEFKIENNSGADIGVSSMISFEAYVDDYSTSMNLSAMLSSDKPQLDGSVADGKKINGVIGYEAEKGWQSIEVRFTPNFWSGKEITFVYSK